MARATRGLPQEELLQQLQPFVPPTMARGWVWLSSVTLGLTQLVKRTEYSTGGGIIFSGLFLLLPDLTTFLL